MSAIAIVFGYGAIHILHRQWGRGERLVKWKRTLTLIDAHAEGEVGRVVTAGVPLIPGASMMDKMNYLNEVDDSIRRFCVFEPRGCAQMSTNLLLPPTRQDADAGFLIMQGDKVHSMSGSNCICVVTVLLETGLLEMHEPQTVVRLDTPAGLVTAYARCHDGKCEEVTLQMVPSFVERLDHCVEVPGLGSVTVDIAFGGLFYGLIDVDQFGLEIVPDNARRLVEIGSQIHRALKESLEVCHPQSPALTGISYVMFTGHKKDGAMVGATVLPPGRLDRSPCGTGNCARLAVRHARGQAQVGERVDAYSIIDSRFGVQLESIVDVAGREAVLPVVSGRGWIHGMHQLGLDPSDPYPQGYLVSDTWGDAFDLLN